MDYWSIPQSPTLRLVFQRANQAWPDAAAIDPVPGHLKCQPSTASHNAEFHHHTSQQSPVHLCQSGIREAPRDKSGARPARLHQPMLNDNAFPLSPILRCSSAYTIPYGLQGTTTPAYGVSTYLRSNYSCVWLGLVSLEAWVTGRSLYFSLASLPRRPGKELPLPLHVLSWHETCNGLPTSRAPSSSSTTLTSSLNCTLHTLYKSARLPNSIYSLSVSLSVAIPAIVVASCRPRVLAGDKKVCSNTH
ncbi:hypothetical protein B0H66DRAFT_331001 [Apodospora peruviana]|uniref:Uncharacterized protein n=1 Tax=Apodospora peruviana TaxID=516989 RepID=A0AAE0HY63_9PEZI|nr:hypothetical protein B0H66DRAFT_331001 [Apodospora peruviana]